MDRNQGTTFGAVLIAALLFRAGTQPSIEPKSDEQPVSAIAASATKVTGDGPWTASCRYWAPDRDYVPSPADEEVGTADVVQNTILPPKYHVTFNDPSKLWHCEKDNDPWGIPTTPTKPSGEAIIAIVPDPVITSMPLKFDRSIDALVNAAAGHNPQRYQSSFYWLPWQPARFRGQRNDETVVWERKSKEPGLIILRKMDTANASGDPTGSGSPANSGPDALYVFLVGETPTTGIDGDQMKRALSYRKTLQGFFESPPSDVVRVIGPSFSGSAPSLARALAQITCATIRSSTSTDLAARYLDGSNISDKCQEIRFQSFSDDNTVSRRAFISALVQSGIPPNQIAVLVEQGTTFGAASEGSKSSSDQNRSNSESCKKDSKESTGQNSDERADAQPDCEPNHLNCYNVIQFPRNIFMLRNAYEERNAKPQDLTPAAPSPYLQFKINGSTPTDDIPNFDLQTTPLSQEAQLMAIQHQLLRYHTRYILIWGSSNILDQIFLAQYFHRALPNARIVFNSSDLLIERETDNTKFIGSLTVSSYHLIGLGNPQNPGFGGFAFPNSDSDSYYNATTATLCAMSHNCQAEDFAAYKPALGPPISKGTPVRPFLWVTTAGADGYYPLGILKSDRDPKLDAHSLPAIPLGDDAKPGRFPLHPSSIWFLLCAVVTLTCVVHSIALSVANYWSPFTRWVAIYQNDDPERLSVYINIGTVALFSMACVVSIPLFVCSSTLLEWHPWSTLAAVATLLSGIAALVSTALKTGKVTWKLLCSKQRPYDKKPDYYFYRWFHRLALAACVLIPGVWLTCCLNIFSGNEHTNVGHCFAFRCLYPQSGVSPLLPTIIVLAIWHVWAIIHSLRHRFSYKSRPLMPDLPRAGSTETSYLLYVADQALAKEHPIASRLVSNISSLLITREVFMRFATDCHPQTCHPDKRKLWHRLFVVAYFLAFMAALFLPILHTLDSMMWSFRELHVNIWPWSDWNILWRFKLTPFELLNRALFFPIIVITLTNWLRMILVWGSLKRGLLQPLEQSPLRFAFDSIKGSLRLSLFKQSGMREQWNDMARSTESIRQFINSEHCKCLIEGDADVQAIRYDRMSKQYDALNRRIVKIIDHLQKDGKKPAPDENKYMFKIERRYQELSTDVLSYVLVPYWWKRKHGLVESTGERPDIPKSETKPATMALSPVRFLDLKDQNVITLEPLASSSCAQSCIEAAEEFIAIRYLAMIRAVLVNLRYLMIFVMLSFVLAITSWNSYPFQPKQFFNWVFTVLLIALGSGIVIVLMQMYHDPLLSRIINKKPNELGWDFIVKVASLIGLPLLSWLAYNYPVIGDSLFKIFQPGTGVVK